LNGFCTEVAKFPFPVAPPVYVMTTLTLYDRQDCPYSKLVRSTLDRLGVDYDETLVPDKHEERTEVEERTGQTGVPVLFDDRVENGFITDSTDIVHHLEDTYGE